jgi:hypothetical protein
MKYNKIIWGIILLFIGGVLLLNNFDIINFYWGSVWGFWPVLLIVFGVKLLFNKNGSELGSKIAIGILVLALAILFFKGQEKRSIVNVSNFYDKDFDIEDDDSDMSSSTLFETFDAAVTKEVNLNIKGGGTSYELKGETDSLFYAKVEGKNPNYLLKKILSDSVANLTFQMGDGEGKKKWNFNAGKSVEIFLNKIPVYNLDLNVGASQIDFNLEDFKVRNLDFNGGAAEVELKFGDLLPITDVNVKSGMATVSIKIPETSGCRIKTKTGLSSKDFNGFTKLSDGVYETPNYKTSTKKIFINFDGGLSSFDVERY